jgi:hypothetical protein
MKILQGIDFFLRFSINGQAQTETAKVYLIREGMHEGTAL